MTHRVRVLAHREGLDIRFEDQRRLASSGNFGQAAGALLHFWTPQTIIAPDGTFVRIEGAEGVRDLVVATLAPIQRVADDVPALREFLAPMLGEGYLQSLQRGEWSKLIWQWIGISSTQALFETASSDQVIPGIEVPTKRTIEVVEHLSCLRAGTNYDCVTIEMRTSMDGVALKSILERLRRAGGMSALSLEPRDYEQLARVTLETSSMLPHDLLHTRTTRGTTVVSGNPVTTTDFESRHSRFTYDRQ